MKSEKIRDSFINFFKEKNHSFVPSALLLPDSPDLLFTNAGMNQFTPFFLGTQTPPYDPARAVNSQKCIRAGGKHNDLEDVGVDSYHHTFFEMLGNWSFGDFFKKEAIQWAWELVVDKWNFPPERIYATYYKPDKFKNEPSELDTEAMELWREIFKKNKLDPDHHVLGFGKKDNFWMMGDTGPCGPCSEIHIDLSPDGKQGKDLVNQDSPLCIEIWNLVFIQFNAEISGEFTPLPRKHVDTGMGFERVCSIMQNSDDFKNFNVNFSNYETDLFRPIIKEIEKISGITYKNIFQADLDKKGNITQEDLKHDVAFRAISDHIRTLVFSIADNIIPSNNGRGYVLRRILRRAVRHGRNLGIKELFLSRLYFEVKKIMASHYEEIDLKKDKIISILEKEEVSFSKTLDRGLSLFNSHLKKLKSDNINVNKSDKKISGEFAFQLYDTYGFPLDLTAQIAAENNYSIDCDSFDKLMLKQREMARGAMQKHVIKADSFDSKVVTEFVGRENSSCSSNILEVIDVEEDVYLITDKTPFYVEMGGQISDIGKFCFESSKDISVENNYVNEGNNVDDCFIKVKKVNRINQAVAMLVDKNALLNSLNLDDGGKNALSKIIGNKVKISIDLDYRKNIEKNHTATHLLHWALHEVVGEEAIQQGSLVSNDRLRFDFSGSSMSDSEILEVEGLVNSKIMDNHRVFSSEYKYSDIKNNKNILQFFGDKYGNVVRVVQVGGELSSLNGFSMELCGGTHVNYTGELGLFKIKSEGAISSGVRRIEAVCGQSALDYFREIETGLLNEINLLKKNNLSLKKEIENEKKQVNESNASEVLNKYILNNKNYQNKEKINIFVIEKLDGYSAELLPVISNRLGGIAFRGVFIFLLIDSRSKKVNVLVQINVDRSNKFDICLNNSKVEELHAGNIIKKFLPLIDGKGGGNAKVARGAGDNVLKVDEFIQKVKNYFFV